MQRQDVEDFTAMIGACLDLYGKPPSTTTLRLWYGALQPFALEEIQRGLTAHMRDPDAGMYAPKPADIIRHIQGATVDRAAIAWSKVTAAVRSIGGWASVAFDDPVIHQVIQGMGGWVKLTQTEEDELPFRAKDFERLYRAFAGQRGEYPPHLAGRSEIERSAHGYIAAHPVEIRLIGDAAAARLTMAGGTREGTHALLGTCEAVSGALAAVPAALLEGAKA